eukprot:6313912-Pyramimonas_sp.AAC.1
MAEEEIAFETEDEYVDVLYASTTVHIQGSPMIDNAKIELIPEARKAFNGSLVNAVEGGYEGSEMIHICDLPTYRSGLFTNAMGVEMSVIAVKVKFRNHVLGMYKKKLLGLRRIPIIGAVIPTFVEFMDMDQQGKHLPAFTREPLKA